jgi:murein DD-endopeptidase MepM/ murein hydrolase activator NlpD
VIIDHGAGVQTVYMHLSKIGVTEGQMVEKGDVIATSGDTGYAGNPHLHLTVRIWEIAIDPMKFLEIMGE